MHITFQHAVTYNFLLATDLVGRELFESVH